MKIDAHHHLWDLSAVNYPWLMEKGQVRFFGDPTSIQRNYLLDEFSSAAKPHGFHGSVHIQVGAESGIEEAKWIQKIADENPDWPLVQVAFCDLTSNHFEEDLQELLKLPSLRGIRQIIGRAEEEDKKTGTNRLLANPIFIKNLAQLAQHNLSFDLQLTPSLIKQSTDVFSKLPNLKVALCHAGSPHPRDKESLDEWSAALKNLAALPNVYCKLSGLGMFDHDWTLDRFRPLVETVIEHFSAQRVMFGSNFPVDSLTSSYKELVYAYEAIFSNLSEQDSNQIFFGTAQKFYNVM